jgi:hypothetical protein
MSTGRYGSHAEHPVVRALVEQDKTRTWLAGELGVSRQALNAWIAGRAPWPNGRKAQVAGLLGADERELFVEA